MDFTLNDEQRLLQDSVRKFVAADYTIEKRRAYQKETDGFSRRNWKTFAELGLLGLPFAEAEGGIGGTAVELMIVMEEFGRGLVVEPYLASVVLAGGVIAAAGSEKQRKALLPGLIEGQKLLALAYGERQARYSPADVETAAKKDGQGFVLNGHKSVVLHGDSAQTLIVSARTSGQSRDPRGISLFLVDTRTDGVGVRGAPTVDGLRAAEIALTNVRVGAEALIGPLDGGLPILDAALDRGCAAVCAEAVGIMTALHELTLDYVKTRQQFGAPIGRNQVIQHRLAEMQISLEQAKSMAMLAAMKANDPDEKERRRAISAAKVQIGTSGKHVGQQAIQLHGGIGMTAEYKAGDYFKRLTMINHQFGDIDYHRARFADISLAAA